MPVNKTMMAIAASIIALSANSYAADDHKGHDHDKKAGAHQDDTKPMYGGVVSSWMLLKASLNILLEGVPEGIGLAEVEKAILEIPGVTCVHDLHVWAITSGKISLTVHAVCTDVPPNYPVTLKAIRSMLADRFDIHHATLQLEDHPCEQATELHAFEPPSREAPGLHRH